MTFFSVSEQGFKFPRVAHFPLLSSKMGLGRGPPALSYLRTLSYSHAWASFNFELWEGQSVSEVLSGLGVQEAGPLAGVVRGERPFPRKILHLVGIRYAISLPIFIKN